MTETTSTPMTKLLTPEQAAELLPAVYNARTLVRLARQKKIGHVRLNERRVFFRDQDIEDFIAMSVVLPKGADETKPEPKPARNPKYATR